MTISPTLLLILKASFKHLRPFPQQLKISPPPLQGAYQPLLQEPFCKQEPLQSWRPRATLRVSSQAGLGSFRLAHYLSRRIVYLQFGTVKGRSQRKQPRPKSSPSSLFPLPARGSPAVPLPAFPLYCNIARGGGGEMRAKPLGFPGRGALAGGAGGRRDVLAEAGKGRRGLRAAFFF